MAEIQLGRWDLSELTKNPKGSAFQKQIQELEKQARKFEKIKSKLDPKMSSKKFMGILQQVEEMSEKMSKIGGYASLLYSSDTQSDEATSLMTQMSKLGSEISNKILFFDLWWKTKVDKKNAKRLMEDTGELTEYLLHKRLFAKYALSEPEERIINTLDVTGISALVKLYDKITNAYEYKMKIGNKTQTMTREELTNYVRSTNPKIRETAYKTILTKYTENKGVIGEIYQNIVLNWRDEGIEIRGYKTPISMRNIGNDVDDKTIESLLSVCKKNSSVFQKFFVQKAKMLKMKKLRRYDLYAPAAANIKEKNYTYKKSVKLVFESLGKFSETLEEFARKVFNENHIDSSVRQGKRDGAFCSTISPKITPYVLVNFTGKSRDVFTLAHELGHAVHSQAAQDRSILVQDAPLPLAETASTFSELLLYDNLSDKISDDEKKIVLSEKIDDLYATILRQSFFTIFEVDAHKQIGKGTTVDEISKTYLQNLKEQFGNSVSLSEDFAIEWSCIPHFYHTPFYCYAYSFGNLLALSLFQRYKKEGKDFVQAYINILAAGGSKKPEKLLSEYGFDIRSTKFWQQGFDYVDEQVKALSSLN
ncbi:M3 family oligoendopeptidase [Marine Group I thaumarchaeote]|jgi:oligoendopeptidase F|uniref:M3 family oligoendopeptidase n=2 Tax=Marine Group I thaumarchaeote TaxID=2511932 RepID=A0A7K4NVY4_9ARCH|nr:M3 family oligoendopeptidase [Marine Group I thaumarchaeote]NWJ57099.1 M3 family oligoendopeptidase [Marine Group I thaumarchaeote]NWK01015.1 M3 family oligoendopeptidase [Marine Group I thaumarchaeote]NWK07196.1 M3 family oligoendopeptidase [Marine Group I thaumarchaeote]